MPGPEPGEHRVFPHTEKGNADRLIHRYGRAIRYCPTTRSWYIFDSKRWVKDDLMVIRELAKASAGSIRDDNDAEDTRKWAKHSERFLGIQAAIELAKSDPEVIRPLDSFDADPLLLNLQNGTLDLRAAEFRDHDPGEHLMRIANASFDKDASSPRWDQFMKEITCGDESLARFLQRSAGYSLTGLTGNQEFYILFGNGANGKSVFMNALTDLLGDYAAVADFKTFLARKGDGPRNDIAALRGSRLVCASEIGPGEHLDETVMKQVTGEDLITARFLYGEFFQFRATFKVWLAANHLPRVIGTEEGIWRRFRIVPFEATFAEEQRDKSLNATLQAERDGILRWAIEGWFDGVENGWHTPPKVMALVKHYRKELDTLQQFIEDQCVIERVASVAASDLYQAYETWCHEAAEPAISMTLFGKKLSELGYEKRKGVKMMRLGLRLMTGQELACRENAA